jgi:hypothetical protein
MIQKNLLTLISIKNCLLKRFQTEGNTYSLKTLFNLNKFRLGKFFKLVLGSQTIEQS